MWGESERPGTVQTKVKNIQGGSHQCAQILEGGVKKMEPGFSPCCKVKGRESIWHKLK